MKHAVIAALVAVPFVIQSAPALAQQIGGGAPRSMVAMGDGDSARAVSVNAPFTFSRDMLAHVEFNLGGRASIGIEGGITRPGDDMSEKQMDEENERVKTEGWGAAVMFSRYSNGGSMSGFYWMLGAGYREVKASWDVEQEDSDPQAKNYAALVDPTTQQLHHDATLKGMTGHLRVGYRYVGEEVPISCGLFVGLRHFQPSVDDAEGKSKDDDEVAKNAADMTDREKERLRRRYTSKFEPGIEIGFAF